MRLGREFVATLCVITLVGCARTARPRDADGEQITRTASSRDELNRLRAARDRTAAEVDAMERVMAEPRHQGGDDDLRELARQKVHQAHQALVAAQLGLIDAKATYGSGHPSVTAAERRVDHIQPYYEDALKQLRALTGPSAPRDANRNRNQIAPELERKRESLRRLDERIRELDRE